MRLAEEARIGVDASSLALSAVVEVDGCVVEDASRLRKDDATHIDMDELDSVIKGLNLALAWTFKRVELLTDLSTVHRWITDALSERSRFRTKAASKMLIRRRIGIVTSMVEEYALQLTVTLVSSNGNKADSLTRVPQRWLKTHFPHPPPHTSSILSSVLQPMCAAAAESKIVEINNATGHLGVKRTLYFDKRVLPTA